MASADDTVDSISPPTLKTQTLTALVFALLGAAGTGTYMGWTFEPQTLTECRVDLVRAEEKLTYQEAMLAGCRDALDNLVKAVESP